MTLYAIVKEIDGRDNRLLNASLSNNFDTVLRNGEFYIYSFDATNGIPDVFKSFPIFSREKIREIIASGSVKENGQYEIKASRVNLSADEDIVTAPLELRVSELISSNTQISDTYIVPDGATLIIKLFEASCPDCALCSCRLIWNFGSESEENLWVIQRQGVMPKERIVKVIGDGSKSIAISCDNNSTSDYYYNSYCKMELL